MKFKLKASQNNSILLKCSLVMGLITSDISLTHYSVIGLTTNPYVVALNDGCLLVAKTKPATHVETISSGLSLKDVTHSFALSFSCSHTGL